MTIQSYRDLKVWQTGMDLVCDVYKVTAIFPKSEVYGLASQIQRAAVSVPSNVAEGHARGTNREFMRFLFISLGSLAELETQLLLAGRLQYVDPVALDSLLSNVDEVGRMLRGLQKSVESKC